MHVSNRVVAVAAVIVLTGAGVTAVALAEPGAPFRSGNHRDDDKPAERGQGHDHGLHLGQHKDRTSGEKDHGHGPGENNNEGHGPGEKDHGNGLHLGKVLPHTGFPPGHDRGLHLGQRPHLRGAMSPGLSKSKPKPRDHRGESDEDSGD